MGAKENHYKANFCNECGRELSSQKGDKTQSHYHIDIAHPITKECREKIQQAVLSEYEHIREGFDSNPKESNKEDREFA